MSVKNRIYIIGAGLAGMSIAQEIQNRPIFGRVVAFLDDNPHKIGKSINQIPVLGPIGKVMDLLKITPEDQAIIAIPSATRDEVKRIYATLKQADFTKIRIVPGIAQVLEGQAHLIQARDINPEDLLKRSPVKVCLKKSLNYLRGKRVLINGAGGSIGCELARQLLLGGAKRLYIFGHGENSIYEIDRELKILQKEGVGEKATIVPILGELQDRDYVFFILNRLKADVIFHSAAHKHVPLLEANPVEAIKNNVFGTKNLVDAAIKAKSSRLVFISTDKAVEPCNIYGASKLLAEEIVLQSGKNGRNFLVVRFGNVLGSRGSILPLFREQILSGGPVTLTSTEAKRFFMTIPEASSLVLKAGGTGKGGELYILDMGKPVLIKEILYRIIEFYSYKPELDIQIIHTGLRKGEKLKEKLWAKQEKPIKTDFPKIMRLERKSSINAKLSKLLEELSPICFFDPKQAQLFRNRKKLRYILSTAIPTMNSWQDEPEY